MRSISYLLEHKFQRKKQRISSNFDAFYGKQARKNRDLNKLLQPKTDMSKMRSQKKK